MTGLVSSELPRTDFGEQRVMDDLHHPDQSDHVTSRNQVDNQQQQGCWHQVRLRKFFSGRHKIVSLILTVSPTSLVLTGDGS